MKSSPARRRPPGLGKGATRIEVSAWLAGMASNAADELDLVR